MPAPKKRRHFLFYASLPFVVAGALLLLLRLAERQRTDLIAELVNRVAHHDAPEAAAAVRQLAEMPRPPIGVLVVAASSSEREVAREAQQAISKLLRRLQRDIDAQRRLGAVGRQLAVLAESLAGQRDSFLKADHPWLVETTRRIVTLANQIPMEDTPLLAQHCDHILTVIAPVVTSHAEVTNGDAVGEDPFVPKGAMTSPPRDTRQASLPRDVATSSTAPSPASTAPGRSLSGSETALNPMRSPSADAPAGDEWRATWGQPMHRMAPTTPVSVSPTTPEEQFNKSKPDFDAPQPSAFPPPQTLPAEALPPERPLARVDSRSLFNQWYQVKGEAGALAIEQELAKRGFGRMSEELVEKLLSNRPEDRVKLVDDVLVTPRVDPRGWLMLLADDADANVRLSAVTIMATSNDAELVEKAWQVAIKDRDPRVAELAGRLRDRRAGIERR